MDRIAWATDIHLNFATAPAVIQLCEDIVHSEVDAVILTGDISDAPALQDHLLFLSSHVNVPIYFVLGNHDFYHSSIDYVKNFIHELSMEYPKLTWLSESGIIPLNFDTCLVGHDSWADGRFGEFRSLLLNDYRLISDFLGQSMSGVLSIMQQQAEKAYHYFKEVLPEAVTLFKKVIVVTHAPPFKEASRYNGKISNVEWLPHFSCKIVGDFLKSLMLANPQCSMTVLCGHTHGEANVAILPNLKVYAGKAVYRKPAISKVINLGELK